MIRRSSSSDLHLSVLLSVSIAFATVGVASVLHPPLLWAIGPHRSRLEARDRVVGAIVFVAALAASVLAPLLIR